MVHRVELAEIHIGCHKPSAEVTQMLTQIEDIECQDAIDGRLLGCEFRLLQALVNRNCNFWRTLSSDRARTLPGTEWRVIFENIQACKPASLVRPLIRHFIRIVRRMMFSSLIRFDAFLRIGGNTHCLPIRVDRCRNLVGVKRAMVPAEL